MPAHCIAARAPSNRSCSLSVPDEFDPWLIRFLLGSKNSLQRAKEYLDKYCTIRALLPHRFAVEPSPAVDEQFDRVYARTHTRTPH